MRVKAVSTSRTSPCETFWTRPADPTLSILIGTVVFLLLASVGRRPVPAASRKEQVADGARRQRQRRHGGQAGAVHRTCAADLCHHRRTREIPRPDRVVGKVPDLADRDRRHRGCHRIHRPPEQRAADLRPDRADPTRYRSGQTVAGILHHARAYLRVSAEHPAYQYPPARQAGRGGPARTFGAERTGRSGC